MPSPLDATERRARMLARADYHTSLAERWRRLAALLDQTATEAPSSSAQHLREVDSRTRSIPVATRPAVRAD